MKCENIIIHNLFFMIILYVILWSYLGYLFWKEIYYLFSFTKNPRFLLPDEKEKILSELHELLNEKKFISKWFYPWIESIEKLPLYSDIINDVIEYFIEAIKEWNKKENDFQTIISYWIWKYEEIYLEIDTEDRERICEYFDQLLEIVWIKSSRWKINNFCRPSIFKLLYIMYFKK
jgi:hypothetical protein